MKERPILFNGEMVRAILDGRKTQTRRVVKPQLPDEPTKESGKKWGNIDDELFYCGVKCPFGKAGHQIWVRETLINGSDGSFYYAAQLPGQWDHVSDNKDWINKNCHKGSIPSIHMPRWASRISLEITNVRVERLQDISEEDAAAEGMLLPPSELCPDINTGSKLKQQFRFLWNKLAGDDKPDWYGDPWVWVIEFKPIEKT